MERSRTSVRLSLATGLMVAGLAAGVAAQRAAAPAPAPAPAPAGQWRTYGGDLASTRYSPLEQINASNFGSLRIAWRFRTDNFGPRPEICHVWKLRHQLLGPDQYFENIDSMFDAPVSAVDAAPMFVACLAVSASDTLRFPS